jgi:hypothetical protein
MKLLIFKIQQSPFSRPIVVVLILFSIEIMDNNSIHASCSVEYSLKELNQWELKREWFETSSLTHEQGGLVTKRKNID